MARSKTSITGQYVMCRRWNVGGKKVKVADREKRRRLKVSVSQGLVLSHSTASYHLWNDHVCGTCWGLRFGWRWQRRWPINYLPLRYVLTWLAPYLSKVEWRRLLVKKWDLWFQGKSQVPMNSCLCQIFFLSFIGPTRWSRKCRSLEPEIFHAPLCPVAFTINFLLSPSFPASFFPMISRIMII